MLIFAYMHVIDAFSALSDPVRYRLFRVAVLAGAPLAVAELVDILQRPQYAVSKAAVLLRQAGLLRAERRGKLVCYTAAETTPAAELAALAKICEPENNYDQARLGWRLGLRRHGKIVVLYADTPAALRPKPRVLFVCVHNSARSQLAEEYLRLEAAGQVDVESAGLTPGELNPLVVRHLAAEGIDIFGKKTRGVRDVYLSGQTYDWVITVCDPAAERDCPVFPEPVKRLSWPFPDPSAFQGTSSEKARQVQDLASEIRARVQEFALQFRHKETA